MIKHQEFDKKMFTGFAAAVKKAFGEKFKVEINTTWNFLYHQCLTYRRDGSEMTDEQMQWIEAYESGFVVALELIEVAANET